MSEATESAPYKKKLHNPLHVTIVAVLVTGLCAFLLHNDTEQKYVFGILLAVTLGMLALEKINKAILVLLGAGIALLLATWKGIIIGGEMHDGHYLPTYIQMVDWGTIGIIIGSTIFVELISRSGLFAWISVKILKVSKGDPFKLLICFSGLTVVFSAFLNNVTAMIIVGSLTIVACKKLKLSAMPFLLAEGIYTNIGGLLTLISSIPNIIVGTAAGIGYTQFLFVAGPYCIIAFVATLYLVRWLFKIKPLTDDTSKAEANAMVDAFDEWETVKDRRFFYLSAIVLGSIILGFALHSSIPVLKDMGLEVVALIGATVMLVIYPTDVEGVLNEVEWTLVLFFIGLFALLGVMGKADVLAMIGEWLQSPLSSGSYSGPIAMMWSSAFFSGLTDNIPLAAVLAKVLGGFQAEILNPEYTWFADYGHMLWWALIFGAGLGGNFTPIGSASTVVAIGILKKEGHNITFMQYVKIGAIVVLVQLALATGYLFGAEKIGLIKKLDPSKVKIEQTPEH
tara:strand:+ start:1109 stop:2638 length:1530 start_codon:yes stop_codon:yes gene_type:complete